MKKTEHISSPTIDNAIFKTLKKAIAYFRNMVTKVACTFISGDAVFVKNERWDSITYRVKYYMRNRLENTKGKML